MPKSVNLENPQMSSKNTRLMVVCLTVVIAVAAFLLIVLHARPFTVAAGTERMPALQGDQAKEFLQKQNLYASLGEAMKAARYQIDQEATPFTELPEALHGTN